MTSIATEKSYCHANKAFFLNVENSYTASHYEITLQQKIGWLENVIQKKNRWCTKGLMAGIQ